MNIIYILNKENVGQRFDRLMVAYIVFFIKTKSIGIKYKRVLRGHDHVHITTTLKFQVQIPLMARCTRYNIM